MYCIVVFKNYFSSPFSLLQLDLTTFFLFLRIKKSFLFADERQCVWLLRSIWPSVAKATLYYKDSDTRGDTLEKLYISYIYRRHTLYCSYFGLFSHRKPRIPCVRYTLFLVSLVQKSTETRLYWTFIMLLSIGKNCRRNP